MRRRSRLTTGCGLLGALVLAACGGDVTVGVGNAGAGGEEPNGGSDGPGAAGKVASGGRSGSGGAAFGGSEVGDGGEGALGGGATTSPFPGEPITSSSKLDLLLVVDNSIEMEEKQRLFREGVATLLQRLIDPPCASGQAAGKNGECPDGSERVFAPVTDLHVGVITTSLGSGGGSDICREEAENDRGRLIPSMRPDVSSWDGRGFAKWDPTETASPPGHADIEEFLGEVDASLAAVGTTGCGYEASLEAWYRFLVDPEPWETVTVAQSASTPTGIDETVLRQRADFLRPDSALAVVLVSDENDCSIIDERQGWLLGTAMLNGNTFRLPKSTSACTRDPNDPCCRSCASVSTPAGCTAASEDAACLDEGGNHSAESDHLNLRCWDQKRRFGVDLLFPVERYVNALTSPTIRDRDNEVRPNPLFAEIEGRSRRPNLVTFAGFVGVPLLDIMAPPLPPRLYTAAELHEYELWPLFSSSSATDLPDDPFMIEAVQSRTGTHPFAGVAIHPIGGGAAPIPDLNVVNGHEHAATHELQFACTFPLAEPRDCSDAVSCPCAPFALEDQSPLCRSPEQPDDTFYTTQYFTGARPSLRQLELMRQLGDSAVVGTACGYPPEAPARAYSYIQNFAALERRLRGVLE